MSRLTITIASGVIVVLACAFWLGPRLMLLAAPHPPASFADIGVPPAPNYADPAAWAALPGPQHKDAADLTPPGETDHQDEAAVDVFYVHPTTLRSRAAWNQNIADAHANALTDMDAIAREASAFNACCRVYAPRYRQATLGARDGTEDGDKALALAYADVKESFRYYLDHFNDGRPFILASDGRGTLYIQKLLEENIDLSAVRPQFVAAYAVGAAIPEKAFGRAYKTIGVCAKPDATGCVVAWTTIAGPAANVCVNPLTFDMEETEAPATANRGSLTGKPAPGPLPELKPGVSGARCKDGVLETDLAGPSDYALFFKNIRENAVLRARAYLQSRGNGGS